ncbi:UNVERIFIED_CONTAM: hypothetical protein FKN15_046107, partial [Acipenser sinensis]
IFPRIPLKDRVKISQNWQRGRCRKEAVLKWKNKDGKIILHQKQGSFSMEYSAHNQEVNCIDSKGRVIVSGSRDRTARVWSLSSNRLGECLHTIPTLDRVWSLAISPSQSSFVTGTACCSHVAPLRIWDVESYSERTECGDEGLAQRMKVFFYVEVSIEVQELDRNKLTEGAGVAETDSCQLLTCLGTDFRRGAGVLDVVYESPSTLLSCGYDTFIRYWDVRASTSCQLLTCLGTDFRRGAGVLDVVYESPSTLLSCGYDTFIRYWDVRASTSCQLLTCLGTDFRRGAGVLDVVYESPSTLLSCGYDTFIRYWDVRASTRKCVMEWEEPHDSALYCIQSDSNHMIASGSSYYGVVRLWDKRQTCCLQTFSLSSPTSSPVYCLRFNSTHLYAALASALYALDFKGLDSRGRK